MTFITTGCLGVVSIFCPTGIFSDFLLSLDECGFKLLAFTLHLVDCCHAGLNCLFNGHPTFVSSAYLSAYPAHTPRQDVKIKELFLFFFTNTIFHFLSRSEPF